MKAPGVALGLALLLLGAVACSSGIRPEVLQGWVGRPATALERAWASGKPSVVNVITDFKARATTVRFSAYTT